MTMSARDSPTTLIGPSVANVSHHLVLILCPNIMNPGQKTRKEQRSSEILKLKVSAPHIEDHIPLLTVYGQVIRHIPR